MGIDRPPGWIPIGPGGEDDGTGSNVVAAAFSTEPAFDELWSYDLSAEQAGKLVNWSSDKMHPSIWSNDELTFFSKDGSLWTTDGTEAGTQAVASLVTQDAIEEGLVSGNTFIFSGQGLWTSDGTSASTSELDVDIGKTESSMATPGEGMVPEFQQLGEQIIFAAENGLYRTTGSSNSTELIRSWETGDTAGFRYKDISFVATPFHDHVVFEVNDPDGSYSLWVSDGTAIGSRRLAAGLSKLRPMYQTQDDVYLQTIEGQILHLDSSWSVVEVVDFSADRTLNGVPDVVFDIVDDSLVVKTTNVVCGEAPNCLWGLEVRAIELGNSSAELLAKIESHNKLLRQANEPFVAYRNGLAFVAVDDESGREIWWTNGQPDGTTLFLDMHPGPESWDITELMSVGEYLLFDVQGSGEIWSTDGTLDGTHRLAFGLDPGRVHETYPLGDQLLIATTDDSGNGILLASDGKRLEQLNPTAGFIDTPVILAELDGQVFFRGSTAELGAELWVTDGTRANTQLAADINPGSASSYPDANYQPGNFPGSLLPQQQINDRFFFVATTRQTGRELWESDGTANGTRLVADIAHGIDSSSPHSMSAVGSDLFFAASGDEGFEPWVYQNGAPEDPLPGDVNGDGAVSFVDFLILSSNFGMSNKTLSEGDLNGDGDVGFVDFLILSENFGRSRD